MKDAILKAMKADAIPAGSSGLWFIYKKDFKKNIVTLRNGKITTVDAGQYTWLGRLTDSTLYNEPPGEIVMEDTVHELRTHLNFCLRARGKILVTGLGLGCVVRGLLVNPAVTSLTVIECDADVCDLVEAHMPPDPRLKIIHSEAEEWLWNTDEKFDMAWHDCWTDTDAGEESLPVKHGRLIGIMRERVRTQGAWAFPREFRRLMANNEFNLI